MMKKFMYILGTIAPSILIVGAILKLQHWPGANVSIAFGTFLLAVVYLPVFAMVSIRDTREKGKKVNKPLYVTGVITGFIFLTGILFKVMHWPGAGIALTVSVLIIVAVFIPILVAQALRDKENQLQNFSILIFILAMMAVNIMVFAVKVSKNVLSSMVVTTEENMATCDIITSRNAQILNGIQNEEADLIAQKTQDLDQYIQNVIAEIVLATHEDNRGAVSMDKQIDLKKAIYLDDHNSTDLVIFGNDKSQGKGEELLKAIDEYKELLMSHASPGLEEVIYQMLDTSQPENIDLSMHDNPFYHAPMIGALNILSNYQLKIRFLEGEVLREIKAR